MTITMNVTPQEFSDIQVARFNLSDADFAGFMHRWYGCQYYQEYKVKVRYDVPLVPWLELIPDLAVKRFEMP